MKHEKITIGGLEFYLIPVNEYDKIKVSYIEAQEKWIKENNIKVGDRVKICKTRPANQYNWLYEWVFQMDKWLNKECTILRIHKNSIRLEEDTELWDFPFYVFTKIEEDKDIKINDWVFFDYIQANKEGYTTSVWNKHLSLMKVNNINETNNTKLFFNRDDNYYKCLYSKTDYCFIANDRTLSHGKKYFRKASEQEVIDFFTEKLKEKYGALKNIDLSNKEYIYSKWIKQSPEINYIEESLKEFKKHNFGEYNKDLYKILNIILLNNIPILRVEQIGEFYYFPVYSLLNDVKKIRYYTINNKDVKVYKENDSILYAEYEGEKGRVEMIEYILSNYNVLSRFGDVKYNKTYTIENGILKTIKIGCTTFNVSELTNLIKKIKEDFKND